MWKTVLAGTTVLAVGAGTVAYAQQGQDDRDFTPRWRPSAEDISAFGDARIAALHAGLKLSAEQEKNWPLVEAALRDLAKLRADWFAARASADRPTDLIERLNLRADTMTRRGAALKKLPDAASPLYKSLDDGQRHRMVLLVRLAGTGFDGERSPYGPPRLDDETSRLWPGRCGRLVRRWSATAVAQRVAGTGSARSNRRKRAPSSEAAGPSGGFFFGRPRAPCAAGHSFPPLLSEPGLAGSPPTVIRAHSSVGRAADS